MRHAVFSGSATSRGVHVVPIFTLDTQPRPPPGLSVFIKMDIEGSECVAIEGGWCVLSRESPLGNLHVAL